MAQRLGAAVGLVPAEIEASSNGRFRITIKTERERAVSGPLQIPPVGSPPRAGLRRPAGWICSSGLDPRDRGRPE